MKTLARLTALCFILMPIFTSAQAPGASPLPAVPTTRILAIGHFNAPPTPDQFKLLAAHEVRDTFRLYLAGRSTSGTPSRAPMALSSSSTTPPSRRPGPRSRLYPSARQS